MTATFKLVLEYDGAAFEGWQIQPDGHVTVQGVLRDALQRLARGEVKLTGAGRTDTGVHAEAQVASAVLETRLDAAALQRALNGLLPRGVSVRACHEAPAGFDARRDAIGKHYRYAIWNAREPSPLRAARFLHVTVPLDAGAMARAAAHLVGEHDFASFQAAGSSVQTTTRTLTRAEVTGEPGAEIRLDFEGTGFLRHMVRNLAGTLVEVGLGKRPETSLSELIAAADRTLAGPTAAAHGLTMVSVRYPGTV